MNALLRLEGVNGTPSPPWENPSANGTYWVLELSSLPEPLSDWQKRIVPLVAEQRSFILGHVVNGARAVLFVETVSHAPSPAVFGEELIDLLSDCSASIEHFVNLE